ncbi:hypothetical protein ABIC83_002750 [Roseateles asaccharophilus]|uniref:hypothetical protein n=1 Tax=Roseateles asaccharophilus TaxID=582607 RepID=UPI0038383CDA
MLNRTSAVFMILLGLVVGFVAYRMSLDPCQAHCSVQAPPWLAGFIMAPLMVTLGIVLILRPSLSPRRSSEP